MPCEEPVTSALRPVRSKSCIDMNFLRIFALDKYYHLVMLSITFTVKRAIREENLGETGHSAGRTLSTMG
jgi:hypothetical protein